MVNQKDFCPTSETFDCDAFGGVSELAIRGSREQVTFPADVWMHLSSLTRLSLSSDAPQINGTLPVRISSLCEIVAIVASSSAHVFVFSLSFSISV